MKTGLLDLEHFAFGN